MNRKTELNKLTLQHMENTANSEMQTDVANVLLKKREQLMKLLKQNDDVINKLQEEYDTKLSELKNEQRSAQDALQHIEALLRLEGWSHDIIAGINGKSSSSQTEVISFIDAAYKTMENLGQPMHYRTIYTKIREQGIYVPGKDGAATLLAKINRDKRFKRIRKRGTYALSFWRIAAAKSKGRISHRKRRK